MKFLVSLIDRNFSKKILLKTLMTKWADRKTIMLPEKTRLSEGGQSHYDSVNKKTNRGTNIQPPELWDGTILKSLFHTMNSSKTKRLRKFIAYFLCYFSFNNSVVQSNLCKCFGFSPILGAVILNNFPTNLLSMPESHRRT